MTTQIINNSTGGAIKWGVNAAAVTAGTLTDVFTFSGGPASTNLLTYSEEILSGWNLSGAIVVSNTILDPSGVTTTADTVTLASFPTALGWDLYRSVAVTSGITYTFSIYVKLGTATNFCVVINNTLLWNSVNRYEYTPQVDLLSTAYWTRIQLTFVAPATGVVNIHLGYHQELLALQTPGTVFLWGAQLEAASVASEYIPTAALAVARGDTRAITTLPNKIPCCRVKSSIAQTVVSGALTAVTFDTKTGTDWWDVTGAFSGSQWKPLISGYYYISAFVLIGAVTTAGELYLRQNGLSTTSLNYIQEGSRVWQATGIGCLNLGGMVYMNGSTDYIELIASVTGTTSFLAGSTFSSVLLMRDI